MLSLGGNFEWHKQVSKSGSEECASCDVRQLVAVALQTRLESVVSAITLARGQD